MSVVLWNAFAFIITLSILVAVHEFGHFWVARRMGVHVLTFSIGFGPALWKRRDKQGCEYVIAAIPLGGYVKMLDEREGDVPAEMVDKAFNRASVRARWAIVAAGPVFNFFLAIFFFTILYSVGSNELRARLGPITVNSVAEQIGLKEGMDIISVNGKSAITWDDFIQELVQKVGDNTPVNLTVEQAGREFVLVLPASAIEKAEEPKDFLKNLGIGFTRLPAVVGSIISGQAADRAGLKVGDVIHSIDGSPILGWAAFSEKMAASKDRTVRLEVQRAAQKISIELIPETISDEHGGTRGYAGVGPDISSLYVTVKYAPHEALYEGVVACFKTIKVILKNIWQLVNGSISLKAVGGPLSIADAAGTTASISPDIFLKFLAGLSVSLGLINLLPIPMLDGGHLLFYSVEAVRGKPLSERVQEVGMRIGLSMVATLMMLALYNDFTRYF